jgi:hypothetical protein
VTTLLLTESPFRDLISRALIAEAVGAVAHDGPMLVATRAAVVPAGFRAVPPGAPPAGVTQVLLTGAFLDRAALEEALATAAAAMAAGAGLLVHNLALEGKAAQIEAPSGIGIFARAAGITTRDHRTANILTLWRVPAAFTILGYPERTIAPDATLAARLPPDKILGIAIRGGEEMRRSWQPRLAALGTLLEPARGWPVLPLPVRPPGAGDDDLTATHAILAAALPGATLLLPELGERAAWQKLLTPARLKALVARCALVVTNRDLVAAYAVAAGVPVTGVALGADRRIVSCLATLANELPAGSTLVHPAPGT